MADLVSFEPDDRDFVYAVVRKLLDNAADADDVTQEALLLAYRNRDTFRGDSRYRTWLYRIALTSALGFLRKRKRSRVLGLDAASQQRLEAMVDPSRSAVAVLVEAEQLAEIERAVLALQPMYREVLLARVDATEPTIAAAFGISVANVKIRTHRARKQLRATLERCAA